VTDVDGSTTITVGGATPIPHSYLLAATSSCTTNEQDQQTKTDTGSTAEAQAPAEVATRLEGHFHQLREFDDSLSGIDSDADFARQNQYTVYRAFQFTVDSRPARDADGARPSNSSRCSTTSVFLNSWTFRSSAGRCKCICQCTERLTTSQNL